MDSFRVRAEQAVDAALECPGRWLPPHRYADLVDAVADALRDAAGPFGTALDEVAAAARRALVAWHRDPWLQRGWCDDDPHDDWAERMSVLAARVDRLDERLARAPRRGARWPRWLR